MGVRMHFSSVMWEEGRAELQMGSADGLIAESTLQVYIATLIS